MGQHRPEQGGERVKRTEKLATYDDLVAAPEHLIAEIIRGRYRAMRGPPHGSAAF